MQDQPLEFHFYLPHKQISNLFRLQWPPSWIFHSRLDRAYTIHSIFIILLIIENRQLNLRICLLFCKLQLSYEYTFVSFPEIPGKWLPSHMFHFYYTLSRVYSLSCYTSMIGLEQCLYVSWLVRYCLEVHFVPLFAT